jgi:hypothetical protein
MTLHDFVLEMDQLANMDMLTLFHIETHIKLISHIVAHPDPGDNDFNKHDSTSLEDFM